MGAEVVIAAGAAIGVHPQPQVPRHVRTRTPLPRPRVAAVPAVRRSAELPRESRPEIAAQRRPAGARGRLRGDDVGVSRTRSCFLCGLWCAEGRGAGPMSSSTRAVGLDQSLKTPRHVHSASRALLCKGSVISRVSNQNASAVCRLPSGPRSNSHCRYTAGAWPRPYCPLALSGGRFSHRSWRNRTSGFSGIRRILVLSLTPTLRTWHSATRSAFSAGRALRTRYATSAPLSASSTARTCEADSGATSQTGYLVPVSLFQRNPCYAPVPVSGRNI